MAILIISGILLIFIGIGFSDIDEGLTVVLGITLVVIGGMVLAIRLPNVREYEDPVTHQIVWSTNK